MGDAPCQNSVQRRGGEGELGGSESNWKPSLPQVCLWRDTGVVLLFTVLVMPYGGASQFSQGKETDPVFSADGWDWQDEKKMSDFSS